MNPSAQAKRCPACASLLDEEDLFCPNCGRESPLHAGGTADQAATKPQALLFKNRFTCEGCGASMSYDASARALRCPFCGSTRLEPQPNAETVLPSKVVPFSVTRQQAEQILHRAMRSGFFLPGDLAHRAVITNMTPVYVPFWSFSATTHTYWTADSSVVPVTARGEWRPLFGEVRNRYDAVLVAASQVLTLAETQGLGRYDFSRAVPPDRVDLDNITYEQFRLPKKYARPIARRLIEELEGEEQVRPLIPGRARNIHLNVKVTNLSAEPVLLPVWILAYRYRDRVYRFVINGQTGRPVGQLPISPWKVALAVAIGIVVVVGILAFIAALMR